MSDHSNWIIKAQAATKQNQKKNKPQNNSRKESSNSHRLLKKSYLELLKSKQSHQIKVTNLLCNVFQNICLETEYPKLYWIINPKLIKFLVKEDKLQTRETIWKMCVRFCLLVQARNQFRPPAAENLNIYSEKQRNFILADFSMYAELPSCTMLRNYVLFLKFNSL